MAHDPLADQLRADLLLTRVDELALDAIDDLLQPIEGNRPLVAGALLAGFVVKK